MSSQVEQIKERLGIQDVLGSYIKLEKTGGNYKARCPFHNEKTPSFFISPGRNTYYCFGCGAKGDIFSFVQEFEGVDFMGSLKILAERAGIELVKENPKARSEREHLYACLESATIFFQKNLYTKEENKEVVEYLQKRGLTKDTIKEWRIGFAEDDWRRLSTYLKEKRFTDDEMMKVGLIIQKEGSRNDYYDRFRGRIMFPLFDSSGRVIGFSGRIFKGDEKMAKYLNSPETMLFNKSEVLYGFHKAKTAIREKDFAILVEGQMDMLMSQQAGFKNTVAVSGTALTVSHLERVQRLANKVVMAFDPDSAGVKAAGRSARIALSLGMEVKVAALPTGEDPALFILNHPDKWQGVLDSSVHIIEFSLNHLLALKLEERAMAKEINAQVLPFIAQLPNAMEKSHFVSLINHKTGFKEEMIWEDLKKAEKMAGDEYRVVEEIKNERILYSRKNNIERKIAGILFWQELQTEPVLDVELIKGRFAHITGEPVTETLKRHEQGKDELILEAEIFFDKSKRLNEETEELLVNLEEDSLKAAFGKALAGLSQAEKLKDKDKAKELLERCKELSDRLSKLPKLK